MSDELTDLISRLRALTSGSSIDLSVADDAADALERLANVERNQTVWLGIPEAGNTFAGQNSVNFTPLSSITVTNTPPANPYPSGWQRAAAPLPDGWYWWRLMPDEMEPEIVQVQRGRIYNDNTSDWEWYLLGEWCGPIPPPPDQP